MVDYLITVNTKEISVKKSEAQVLDLVKLDDANFHLLQNNKAYKISLLQTDFQKKSLKVSVNGNTYDIKIEDTYDQLVKKMGLLSVGSQKVSSIKAPMPGLIIDVMVEEGEKVFEGTPLLVLSAMKMENMILSQTAGVIKSIEVKKNDTVEKSQLIIEME